MTMSVDWESTPCRRDGCKHHAVGLYHVPEGCDGVVDPVQALCEHHFIHARPSGPMWTIVSWRTEMDAKKELAQLKADLSRERNKLYKLRAEALKFTSVREATRAYEEMLEASLDLQRRLEGTRAIIRDMLRFMGEAFEEQEDRYGTAFPVASVPDPGDGSACGARDLGEPEGPTQKV
jgi:hypothetical protein